MASHTMLLEEQAIANPEPREVSELYPITQVSGEPDHWISTQQAIDKLECELERFCSGMPSLCSCKVDPVSSTRWTQPTMIRIRLFRIAPTEIENIVVTSDTGPAVLIANIYIPKSFPHTPESLGTLRRDYILVRGSHAVVVHRDPAYLGVPAPEWCPSASSESSNTEGDEDEIDPLDWEDDGEDDEEYDDEED